MATQFMEIYTRALSNFQSPVLSRLLETDLIKFNIIMHSYLESAITYYNPNKEVEQRLADRIKPIYLSQSFETDGVKTEFELTQTPYPTTTSIFEIALGECIAPKTSYSFNDTENKIVFHSPPPSGLMTVNWYITGQFNNTLTDTDKTLLSLATTLSWLIQANLNQQQIDGYLMDTDFKLHSAGNVTYSKTQLIYYFEEMYKRELSKADWRSKFRR